mmetsp:Transcript_39766/g.124211  ORF Transcript_39766/g.124211 Transcript_39766/m.124211 type:complete len:800 (-) Transcript_39766:2725-5124(-)|eukprot:CAMPEP_0118866222 /NCGR_PEP_ID=MMETSP1163-20130328/10213_1 /TAXON_ID=124430 /ORGANISM="Phaeomonas parva, Strain CCMP2877" /LENGTH=799 /DNA_ID=CAMNT_0006800521 /DNA_START=269 /DNA_END=2668 /DNA_ORIENTATION=-
MSKAPLPSYEDLQNTVSNLQKVIKKQAKRIITLENEITSLRTSPPGAKAKKAPRRERPVMRRMNSDEETVAPDMELPSAVRTDSDHTMDANPGKPTKPKTASPPSVPRGDGPPSTREALIARLSLSTELRRQAQPPISSRTPKSQSFDELATPTPTPSAQAKCFKSPPQDRKTAKAQHKQTAKLKGTPPRSKAWASSPATSPSPARPPLGKDGGLWVFHDNPALGGRIRQTLAGCGAMNVLIETPEWHIDSVLDPVAAEADVREGTNKQYSVMITARIVSSTESPAGFQERGSQVLELEDLVAHRSVPIRPTSPCQQQRWNDGFLQVRLPSTAGMRLGTALEITEFFDGANGRIDIILEPNHDGAWYPIRDTSRNLAPQFRSQGIGYIRLGDDMGRKGAFFLSVNQGRSFLRNDAVSPAGAAPVAAESSHGAGATTTHAKSIRQTPPRARRTQRAAKSAPQQRRGWQADREKELVKLLGELDNNDAKWTQRVECLKRTAKLLEDGVSKELAASALSLTEGMVGRRSTSNPRVTREVLNVIAMGFFCLAIDLADNPSWRPLLEYTLLASRGKALEAEVNSVLSHAHACVGLEVVLPHICAFADVDASWASSSATALGRPLDSLLRKSRRNVRFGPTVLDWLIAALDMELQSPSAGARETIGVVCASRAVSVALLGHRRKDFRDLAMAALAQALVLGLVLGADGTACADATLLALPEKVRDRLRREMSSIRTTEFELRSPPAPLDGATSSTAYYESLGNSQSPHSINVQATPRGGALAAARAAKTLRDQRNPLKDMANKIA